MNNLRIDPNLYVPHLQDMINHIDINHRILDYSNEYGISIMLPEGIDTYSALEFLKKAEPVYPIKWSEMASKIAAEDLSIMMQLEKQGINIQNVETNSKLNDYLNGNFRIYKILSNFILEPQITILIIFLLSSENRNLIFSDNLFECGIASLTEPEGVGKSLLYLIAPDN
jgi:hypothetical protein